MNTINRLYTGATVGHWSLPVFYFRFLLPVDLVSSGASGSPNLFVCCRVCSGVATSLTVWSIRCAVEKVLRKVSVEIFCVATELPVDPVLIPPHGTPMAYAQVYLRTSRSINGRAAGQYVLTHLLAPPTGNSIKIDKIFIDYNFRQDPAFNAYSRFNSSLKIAP